MKDKQKIVDEFLNTNATHDVPETADEEFRCEIVGDKALARKIIAKLVTVYDPEIPVNIYDLGLIYKIDIDADNNIKIDMTLTAPGCPVAHTFPSMVAGAVQAVDEVNEVDVVIVWDPPWTQERMSEAAKLELGMF